MAVVTRLGLGGFPRGLYGSFAGKTEAEVPEVEEEVVARLGGGGKPLDKLSRPDRDNDDDDKAIIAKIQRFLDAEKGKPAKTKSAKARKAKRAEKIKRVDLDLAIFRKATPETARDKLADLTESVAALDAKLAKELREEAVLINKAIYDYYDDLAIVLLLAA